MLQNEINELGYIVDCAYEKGMVIVLNPSPMNEKILALDLSRVSMFILNEIEAGQLLGSESRSADTLIPGLLQKFPGAKIVLTLGSDGSCYADGTQTVRQGIYKVKAVDTTAAGDTFSGFFIAGTASGKSVAESLDLAALASSIAVSRAGAAPSIPTMEEVRKAKAGCMKQ